MSLASLQRIMSNLVSNETLARVSCRLQLPGRILAAEHQAAIVRAGTDAQATAFQAYLGALLMSGMDREDIVGFVKQIFDFMLFNEYEACKKSHPTAETHGEPYLLTGRR